MKHLNVVYKIFLQLFQVSFDFLIADPFTQWEKSSSSYKQLINQSNTCRRTKL